MTSKTMLVIAKDYPRPSRLRLPVRPAWITEMVRRTTGT